MVFTNTSDGWFVLQLRAIIMKQKDLDANAITRLCRSTAYYCFVDATVEAVKLYPLSHEDIFMHVLVTCNIAIDF